MPMRRVGTIGRMSNKRRFGQIRVPSGIRRPPVKTLPIIIPMKGGSVGSVVRGVVRGVASGGSKIARAAGFKRASGLMKGIRLATFRGAKRNKGYKLIGKMGRKMYDKSQDKTYFL